jgi:hypothetical protein
LLFIDNNSSSNKYNRPRATTFLLGHATQRSLNVS